MLPQRIQDDPAKPEPHIFSEKYVNSHQQKKRWKWIIAAIVAVVVIIIAIVVPVAVTQTRKHQQQQQQQPQSNVIDTGNSQYPVSNYAHMVGIHTNNDPDLISKERIFVIGDVHGCIDEFNNLVDTLNYTEATDQLILVGDLTSKGPDSGAVLRRAKELGALCVRGNHDDKIVRIKTFELQNGKDAMVDSKDTIPEGNVTDPLTFDNEHVAIAMNLTQEEYDYLSNCPVILHLPYFNNTVVVHGGLDPNINSLEEQVPYLVMNMRDIDDNNEPTKDNKDGIQWAEEWNVYQDNATVESREIFYGHDASRGLNIQEHTFGVDTGCVYGRKLTAINIKTKELTSVKCKEYSK